VPDALVALFVHEGPPPSVRVPVRQQVSLVKLQEHLFTDAARRELGSRLAEAARESHSMDGGVAAYAETYRRALARRRRWAARAVERSEPYCVLQCRGDARAPDRTLHATGDGRPTRKCMSLSYFGTDGGVLRGVLLSPIGRAGAGSAECHVRRAVREISRRGDTCSARIDTRRPTVEDARRSRNLLSCLQGVFRVPLMPIA
jgi:hypothetical protein